MLFLEALVDPAGRPRGRFAGGALVLRGLCGLGVLLWLTSIHGSCHTTSGWSIVADIAGSSWLGSSWLGSSWLGLVWLAWFWEGGGDVGFAVRWGLRTKLDVSWYCAGRLM